MTDHSDVLIIGAGFSGIGAAYRIHEKNPHLSYTILERRERLGGTWDLFRYPGIRSDSDIFTLSFPWEPWTRPEMIADGDHIWEYMADTARKHGIDEHIRFNTYVRSADWDSATDIWTVQTEQDGEPKTYRARFLFFGTGYYNYDEPYPPTFPGIESFKGEVVHPQHWPDELDYTGKRLVVIGSGATAVSMIPSLTEKAAHVTMLQRTPSYMMSMPRESTRRPTRSGRCCRAGSLTGSCGGAMPVRFGLCGLVARKAPRFSKRLLRGFARARTCRRATTSTPISSRRTTRGISGCASCSMWTCTRPSRRSTSTMVTDHVDHMDATGIALKSGGHLDADVIITATGIQLQALGGITVSVDGEKINPHDRFVFRRHLLEDVPERGVVRGLHECVLDPGRRPYRALSGETVGVHGLSRLHPCLSAPRRRRHARTARIQPAGGLCPAVAGRDAEVGHPQAVGADPQLPARRARPPLRVDRGVDGVRPRDYGVSTVNPVASSWLADSPKVVLNRSARCDGLAKPDFIAASVMLAPAAMAVPACTSRTQIR